MGWGNMSQAYILIHTRIHTHTNLLLLNYSILETSYPYLLEIHLTKSFPVNPASSLCPAGPRWSQPLTVPAPLRRGAFVPLPLLHRSGPCLLLEE